MAVLRRLRPRENLLFKIEDSITAVAQAPFHYKLRCGLRSARRVRGGTKRNETDGLALEGTALTNEITGGQDILNGRRCEGGLVRTSKRF